MAKALSLEDVARRIGGGAPKRSRLSLDDVAARLGSAPSATVAASQPVRPRPIGATPSDLASVPTGKRTDQIVARRAGQGKLPTNPRAMLDRPRAATFEPVRVRPDDELVAALDAIDQGAVPAELGLRVGPTANRSVVADYFQADSPTRQTIRAELAAVPPPPVMGRPRSAAGSFVQGVTDVLAGVPKSVAIGRASGASDMLAAFDKVDRGEEPALFDFPFSEAGTLEAYRRSGPEGRAEIRSQFGGETDPRTSPLYTAGETLSKAVRTAVPSDPAYRGEFFAEALPQGAGSTLGFLGGGLLAKALGLPAAATTAGLGMGAQAASQFQDALSKGASIATAVEAAKLSLPAGASEALPISRMLDRLDKGTGGTIRRAIMEAIKGGTEEALQEAGQTIMSNAVAQGLYDPERGWLDGAGQGGAVGFTTGALFNFLMAVAGGRRGAASGDTTGAPDATLLDRVRGMLQPERAAEPERIEPFLGPVAAAGESAGPASAAGPVVGTAAPVAPQPVESAPESLPADFTPNAEPLPGVPPAKPAVGRDVAVTPTGRRVDVEYRLADAAELVTSHTPDLAPANDYPAELQPRDRTRAASEAQIAQIAGNLQPELLGRSSSAAEGAPIIGPDKLVESGNARVLAIRRAYAEGKAESYRDWLRSQGYDVAGLAAPVLVRVRTTELSPEDRIAFTREANQRTTLAPGAAEQATADARSMSPALVDSYRGGDLTAAANRGFVRGFIDAIIPPSERGSVIGPDGAISQDGLRRIENAVFSRAYGEPAILSALREDTDSNIKAIGAAMVDAAPVWMKLRADVAAGRARPEMDITPALVDAVNVVSRARRQGMLVSDIVTQRDMLGGGVSVDAQAVLRLMYSDPKFRRPVSRQRLASALTFYADQARKAAEGGLALGDTLATPQAILGLARGRGTGEMFDTLPDAAEMRTGGGPASSEIQTEEQAQSVVDSFAPIIETADDVKRLLDRNVAEGNLSKEAAADVMAVLRRFPHNTLKGVRVLIQRRIPRDVRIDMSLNVLDTVIFRGSVIPYDGGETVLLVPDRRSAATTGAVFAHENGHLIYNRLMTEADRAEARRIYDGLPVSRHSAFTAGYALFTSPRKIGDVRFQEWFAESFADWARSRVKMQQRRKLSPTSLDELFHRLFRRVVDLFSNEKKVVDAFIDGLDQKFAQRTVTGTGEVSVDAAESVLPAAAESQLPETAEMQPGKRWKGNVPEQPNLGAARRKNVLRREQILSHLMKALGVPLYQGRIKSKRTLGFYRRHIEEVRVKFPSDIETTAHEVAHLLDDRIPEIRAQWFPASATNATVREELKSVSYDDTKLYEGFAEYLRLWMTQPAEAQKRAPTFNAWWENFLNRSEYGKPIRKAQSDMLAWFAQNALDRARSKIGKTRAVNEGLDRPFDKFRQSITDDLHGIALMERQLTGSVEPMGAYETARLTRASASIVGGMIDIGQIVVNADGSHSFKGKSLREILRPVASRLDDFLLYAVGKSAEELRGQGREHLFSPVEIAAMTGLETAEFKKAFAEYQIWNNAVVDFAQDKGIVNPKFRREWRRSQYLPFHRVGQPGAFQPVPGDWRGIRALTGGSENLRDVLQNIIGNAAMLVEAALTNEARQKAANLANLRGGARFMARIPTEDATVRVHLFEVQRAILQALGVSNVRQLDPDTQKIVDQIIDGMEPMVALTLKGQTPKGVGVIAVLDSGKPTYYEVPDPLVLRAITALKRPTPNWIVRILSVPKRIGQASITLSFDFMAGNIARDTLAAGIMSRHGFRPLIDSAKGFKSRLMTDQNYKEFIANGGGLASHLLDETAFRAHLASFYGKRGIDFKAVLTSPRKLLFMMERLADSFEMSTRLGEYQRAIRRGEHPRHAAYSAREVSADFAMRGDSQVMGFFYDTVIFLKAAMVSLDRLYRGVTQDPNKGKIIFWTGMLALASAGLYMLNRGNPLYDELEDWDRDTSWHFFIPRPETLKALAEGRPVPEPKDAYWHFRYPKIWEIGAVSSIAERQLEGILDGQPVEAQLHALRIIMDLFSVDALPQAVSPLYELAINKDRFTNRQIENASMREVAPWARSNAYTSATLRWLGEHERNLPTALQISPAQMEHLIRGYTNTWGMYGLMFMDGALFDDKPDLRTDKWPVVRRFYSSDPQANIKAMTELYEAIDEVTEARRTLRWLDRQNRPEYADEIIASGDAALYRQMTMAQRRLQGFRKETEAVYNARGLAEVQEFARQRARAIKDTGLVARAGDARAWDDVGALKRFLIDDILAERNEFAKEMMRRVEEEKK